MPPEEIDELNPQSWFLFAAERLRGADSLWKHEGLTMLGVEALQECVERFLKGYLIAKGWRLEKTHDLVFLTKEAGEYNARFDQFRQMAEELTNDFFAQHYPGHDISEVGRNYESFRQQTGELVDLIRNELPEHFQK